jgi:hypothetical protein
MHNPIKTQSKLFTGLGTPLLGWLIKSTHVYSIRFNYLIDIPKNSSNLNCKINIMFFAVSIKMQNPLWRLIVFMLQFVVGGCHQGLFLRQVSMNLQIGLALSIFVSNNGKASWSMWVFHLQTSYDSLSLSLIQIFNYICTLLPSRSPFPFDISNFDDISFLLIL